MEKLIIKQALYILQSEQNQKENSICLSIDRKVVYFLKGSVCPDHCGVQLLGTALILCSAWKGEWLECIQCLKYILVFSVLF